MSNIYETKLAEFNALLDGYKKASSELYVKSASLRKKIDELKAKKLELERALNFSEADVIEIELQQKDTELSSINARRAVVDEVIKNGNSAIKEKAIEVMKASEDHAEELTQKIYSFYDDMRAMRKTFEEELKVIEKDQGKLSLEKDLMIIDVNTKIRKYV